MNQEPTEEERQACIARNQAYWAKIRSALQPPTREELARQFELSKHQEEMWPESQRTKTIYPISNTWVKRPGS